MGGVFLVLSLAIAIATAALPRAQSIDDFFDPTALHEVRLFIHSRDVQQLRTRYLENTFYPADFQWRDVRVRNVAVRQRGLGSRSATKMGLLVDFDRYKAGQTFLGRQSLVLDNLWQDPSLVRERVAMALFARMGQPAPLESYARVYLNNEYQGVYALVEAIDSGFLTRTTGSARGYLYEYHWLAPYYFGDLGDDLNVYKPLFEPRTRGNEPDAAVYGPLRSMVQAVNAAGGDWRARVERYVDLPQLVTHVAIESFMAEWDGVLGYAGVNNFYLYRPAGSERHVFFPWDRDHATVDPDGGIFRRAGENVLVRQALAYPDLYALYLEVLEQTARAASENGWLESVVQAAAAITGPAAADDVRKPFTNQQQEEAVALLIDFARRRPASVLAQVASARASPAFVP
jgi:spore coat protein CotH